MDSRRIAEKQARIATCEQAIIHCERIIAKATANLAILKKQSRSFWGASWDAKKSEFDGQIGQSERAIEKRRAEIAKLNRQLAPFVKAGA